MASFRLPDVPRWRSSQLVEKRLCFFQIGRGEAFGERAVDGREQRARLVPPALLVPEAGEAGRSAQFVAPCALLAGDRQGGAARAD